MENNLNLFHSRLHLFLTVCQSLASALKQFAFPLAATFIECLVFCQSQVQASKLITLILYDSLCINGIAEPSLRVNGTESIRYPGELESENNGENGLKGFGLWA